MSDAFYDELAAVYHLIFENWDVALARQGEVLQRLLPPPDRTGLVLDATCGIGTQTLALARRGYRLEGVRLTNHTVDAPSGGAEVSIP